MNKEPLIIYTQNKDMTWIYKIVDDEQIIYSEVKFQSMEQIESFLITNNIIYNNIQVEYYFDNNWNLNSREDCLTAIKYSGCNLRRFPIFLSDYQIFNMARLTSKAIQENLDYYEKHVRLGVLNK